MWSHHLLRWERPSHLNKWWRHTLKLLRQKLYSSSILQFIWKSCQVYLQSVSRIPCFQYLHWDLGASHCPFLSGLPQSFLLLPLLPYSPFSTISQWSLNICLVMSLLHSESFHDFPSHTEVSKNPPSASLPSTTIVLPREPINSSLVHSALATMVSSPILPLCLRALSQGLWTCLSHSLECSFPTGLAPIFSQTYLLREVFL